jgi:hypothetical protein
MGKRMKVMRNADGAGRPAAAELSREACLDLLVLAMEVSSWRKRLALDHEGEWFPSDNRRNIQMPEALAVDGARCVFL